MLVFCFLILYFSRQTGALNRIIDRGSRAINYILSQMVFNVVPTALEVYLIAGWSLCRPRLAILLLSNIIISCLEPCIRALFSCFIVICILFQIAMVSGILAYNFGSTFAWITSVSVAAYVAFTLIVTQVWCFTNNLLLILCRLPLSGD